MDTFDALLRDLNARGWMLRVCWQISMSEWCVNVVRTPDNRFEIAHGKTVVEALKAVVFNTKQARPVAKGVSLKGKPGYVNQAEVDLAERRMTREGIRPARQAEIARAIDELLSAMGEDDGTGSDSGEDDL
jgi:hypothetical protein